jgi:hypothetical protein
VLRSPRTLMSPVRDLDGLISRETVATESMIDSS